MPEVIDFYMVSRNRAVLNMANGENRTVSIRDLPSILQNGDGNLQMAKTEHQRRGAPLVPYRGAEHRAATVVRIRMIRRRTVQNAKTQKKAA